MRFASFVRGLRRGACVGVWGLAVLAEVHAQGEYVHFEPGQVQPIAVATLVDGGLTRDLLLVCNTPDDCVEIYDAAAPFAFVQRVPTGLTPVTVRFNAEQQALYTCNFVGDSVTKVTFATWSAGGALQFKALVDRTVFVGDEPADIAFDAAANRAVVTLHSRSGMAVLDASDLATITPLQLADVADGFAPNVDAVLKHPTQMQMVGGDRLYVLDRQDDDGALEVGTADFDLLVLDATGTATTPSAMNVPRFMGAGLGTTPHAFAIDSSSTRMFVVGMDAQHQAASGEVAVSLIPTGFVRSFLWVVDLTAQAAPVVRGEWDAASTESFPSINLNRDYGVAGPALAEVSKVDALAQPAGIALIEGPAGIEQIVLTNLSSDVVAWLVPDADTPGGYAITRVPVPPFNPAPGAPGSRGEAGYGMTGPCGIAYHGASVDPSAPGSRGLIYVTGAFDNSVAVISPATRQIVGRFQLRHDPTTAAIRAGRKFQFSAEFSGNGTVSCSSCHIWSGTDGIDWDLGTANGPNGPAEIHPWLIDGVGKIGDEYPEFKGTLVTQTLHGLVNARVDGPAQRMFTNAPYHWRGDRDEFSDFNGAFVGLMRMTPEPGAAPGNGITDAHMAEFTAYIEEVVHEPNPEQDKFRVVRGDLGDPFDTLDGSGAARGLKAFHIEASVGLRSCVHCHQHPEGSNNRITEFAPRNGVNQPLEAASLRSLFDREMLVRDSTAFPVPGERRRTTNSRGLSHDGIQEPANPHRSINDFCALFVGLMPGTVAQQQALIEDVTAYVRGYDTGIAPMVGMTWTLGIHAQFDTAVGTILTSQVEEANAGLAIYLRQGSDPQTLVETGWWQDLTVGPKTFRLEGTTQTRPYADFVAFAGSTLNRVVLQTVPVGSARRYAALGRDVTPLVGTNAPANPGFPPMAPATHWVHVGALSGNWDPDHPTHPFGAGEPNEGSLTPSASAILRLGKAVLEAAANGRDFGLRGLRHEPPRRFRVTGDNILAGAELGIGFVTPGGTVVPMWLPIFPTKHMDAVGSRIWETTVEADDLTTMGLLCGSLWTPGVMDVIRFRPPSQPLDAAANNRFTMTVRNEDGSMSMPTWQALTVQYDR